MKLAESGFPERRVPPSQFCNLARMKGQVKMVSISVLVPTFQEARYLPNLLASLKRQEMKDFETILVDGGSTDGTQEVARKFGARIVTSPGLRGFPSLNLAAEIAKGGHLPFHWCGRNPAQGYFTLVKTNEEAIARASFDFPADSTTTVHIKQSGAVLLWSYEQLCPQWMIEVFLGIFWAYTRVALCLIGFMPRVAAC